MDRFIARWRAREGGAERANYVLFLTELLDALGLPHPDPAGATTAHNDYVFERQVRGDLSQPWRIDLYKRGCFVLEAKQSLVTPGKVEAADQGCLFTAAEQEDARRGVARRFDVLMRKAFNQAWTYAQRLDPDHESPPFLLVCDIGRTIEVYADFSGGGRDYRKFPDARSYRIALEDLASEEVQARLRAIWTDPRALDPARRRAVVTREIAQHLAQVSKGLEARGKPPTEVASFLMRCLFAMFAESMGLLPEQSFKGLLTRGLANPQSFMPLATQLFEAMDKGTFAFGLEVTVRRFNGAFYKDARAFELEREEIGALIEAAGADWSAVEPAIFGTLLEQALDPAERSRLGAHYTPRPYVERLVRATVIEPLRETWAAARTAADRAVEAGDADGARRLIEDFHTQLTATRVLDPATGTGNFLYVSLLLMRELEADALDALEELGGQRSIAGLERKRVDPSQFLGLELNPRAAVIAELVLWIGYLQDVLKRSRDRAVEDPVLKAFGNINGPHFRRRPEEAVVDAVLLHDGPIAGGGGVRYPNPRRPAWPEAEFIVGNPPFIGGKDLRAEQGDDYAQALWAAHKEMNDSADYVMYWWNQAAEVLTRKGSKLRRFGLVTTNSITQVFQRRTVQRWMSAQNLNKTPLSIVYAIADHPWTKATRDAAAVRIAITVAEAGAHEGRLLTVVREEKLDTDQPEIEVREAEGKINADLTLGVDLARAKGLLANEGMCARGMVLHGSGFIVSRSQAEHLGLGRHDRPGLEAHIRPYRNGRDLTGRSREQWVIDLYGLEERRVRERFPEVHDHITRTVRFDFDSSGVPRVNGMGQKTGREWNNRAYRRDNWWLFGENIPLLRDALGELGRYIVTVETAKHRTFQFVDKKIIPDNKLVAIASEDVAILSILSSRMHEAWYLANAGKLGVYERDAVYVKSTCFDPFPFPELTLDLRAELAELGEGLDAHRKARLAEHPELTLTKLYNAMEAVRAHDRDPARTLTPAESKDAELGAVRTLIAWHDDIDRATLAAYGWSDLRSNDGVLDVQGALARLVALNAERRAEEATGRVRWLRPAYQMPRFARGTVAGPEVVRDLVGEAAAPGRVRPAFPHGLTAQQLEVIRRLARSPAPLAAAEIAAGYKGRRVLPQVEAALRALARQGDARVTAGGRAYTLQRAA